METLFLTTAACSAVAPRLQKNLSQNYGSPRLCTASTRFMLARERASALGLGLHVRAVLQQKCGHFYTILHHGSIQWCVAAPTDKA